MEFDILSVWEDRLENITCHGNDSCKFNFIGKKKDIAVPYLIFISFLTFVGTFGNALVLGALVINKKLRTIGNLFVANLAIADLCVTGFVNAFSIVGMVYGREWFDNSGGAGGLCKIIGFICTVSCIVSMLTITAISINRYIHICLGNIWYTRIFTKLKTLFYCFALWFVPSIMQIPAFTGLADYKFDLKTHSCLWDRLHQKMYLHTVMGTTEVLTAVVVIYCYIEIFRFVRMTRNSVTSSRTAERERDESIKLARTIAVIFLVYFFCWIPYTIISLGDRKDQLPLPVHLWAITMAHANSSANSVIYAATNQQFRIGFMQLLLIDRCIALYRTYIRDQDSTKEGKSNLAFVETSLQTSFASVASIGSEGTEAKA